MIKIKNENFKIIIFTIATLIIFFMTFYMTKVFLTKDIYYFQVSPESKWVVNEGRIEISTFNNKFVDNGIIYHSEDELWLSEYTVNIYLNYLNKENGKFYIEKSSVSTEGVHRDEIYYGYNIGGRGYHTFETIDFGLLDMSTAFIEVIYNYDSQEIVDTIPIDLMKNDIGYNKLPSAYKNRNKKNVITPTSDASQDLFYIGMKESDLNYIVSDLGIVNSGFRELRYDERMLISFGYNSEITIQIEDGEAIYIDVFSEFDVIDNLGFDDSMKEFIEAFGNDYRMVNDYNGTKMIEYSMNGYYLSFVFTNDKLNIWSLSKMSKIN